MRSVLSAVAVSVVLSLSAVSSPEAALGTGFADLYSAFAPLYSLYRSYADHLFTGGPVVVPTGIGSFCQGVMDAIAGITTDLLTQTASDALALLRAETDGFCASYLPILEGLERSGPDEPLLERASDERLFASIYELNGIMEEALSGALSSLDEGVERWGFAVAFSVRTIIDKDGLDRIDEDLRRIFYGDRDSPPVDLPDRVEDAMDALISLSGRHLTEEEADRARHLAFYIEHYFVFDSLPDG